MYRQFSIGYNIQKHSEIDFSLCKIYRGAIFVENKPLRTTQTGQKDSYALAVCVFLILCAMAFSPNSRLTPSFPRKRIRLYTNQSVALP